MVLCSLWVAAVVFCPAGSDSAGPATSARSNDRLAPRNHRQCLLNLKFRSLAIGCHRLQICVLE